MRALPLGEGSKCNLSAAATPYHTESCMLLDAVMPLDTLEQRIRYARIKAGLSGVQLAEKMSINKDYYWMIEKKADRISVKHLQEIANATGETISFLAHGPQLPEIRPLAGATIGARIHTLRVEEGLSAREFCRKIGIASSSSIISGWELERYVPELRSLMIVASAFGISVESMIP